jgi:predicted PurR-regulated permease PerM
MAIGRMALQRTTGDRPDDDESRPTDPALRRGFDLTTPARAGLAVLGVVLLIYVAGRTAGVLLLLFAGILLAVLLRAASDGLNRLTGLPVAWCLALVVLALIAGVAVGGWLAAPFLVEQTVSFAEGVVNAVEELEGRLREADWAEAIAERINLDALLPDPGGILGGATGLLTATFGTLATLAIILFFGVYLAANPGTYVEGFILLLPPARRLRARYVLSHVGHTLRWWLIGQAVSMVVIGAVSFVGLWLLGVPFAAPLAVLAGLLTFVPYLGAILSSIPIALVALTESPMLALYTLAFYAVLHLFEGYVLTPLVQRQTVHLPPALNIFAQVLLSVLLGAAGLMLATPLTAAALVTVKLAYLEGVLGEEVKAD